MDTLVNALVIFAGIVAGIVVMLSCVAFSIAVYLGRRGMSAHDTNGVVEKIKKAVKERPPWLVAVGATAGGWLFLLFAVWVLLPSVWQSLSAHPALLWMPPLCIVVAGLLYAPKKQSRQLLAGLVILVLLVGVWQSFFGERSGVESRFVTNEPTTVMPARFDNCTALPANNSRRKDTAKLAAPVGVESTCYLIRNGYWFRISPKNEVRIRWQHGLVQNLSPKRIGFIPLGDSIRNAAFTLMSLEEKPAIVVIGLEKKS